MKHNMNRVLSMIALMMLTVGTWAEQTITINASDGGAVTKDVKEGVCTLMVTPDPGYYLEKLEAVATLDGGALQAPQRRNLPINDGVQVEITPTNAYADPATTTTHTFTIPTTDYNVEVTATFTKGDVIVGDKAVTDVNMKDVFGDGKVAFNTETNTLTLNGATIDMTSAEGSYPVESNVKALKVMLIGNNVMMIKQTDPLTQAFRYTGEGTDATLTFMTDDSGTGTLTIEGGALANQYDVDANFPATGSGWSILQQSNIQKLSYKEYYGLKIGNEQFTSDKLTITAQDGGTATYNNVTKTLRLKNFVTTGNVTSTLSEDLAVIITGINSVGTISGTGKLTISKNELSEATYNKLSATAVSGFTVSVTEPLKEMTAGKVYSDLKTYELWVCGTQVTDENKGDIRTDAISQGNISFDGNQTLTLNGIVGNSRNYGTDGTFIVNGLSKLTINLVDENTVNCGQFLASSSESSHTATFTTSLNSAGSLTINNDDDEWYTGHTVAYNNNLELTENNGIIIAAPKTVYALTIAGTQVTNLNANNVLNDGGKVSFDARTNTLTLNGATISGNITSGIETLLVNLKGENSMTGQFVKADNGENLIFETQDTNGKLTMGGDFSGLTAEYRNKLKNVNNTILLPAEYGITVNSTSITPANHEDVFADGTVLFDGEKTLTLNGASLNSITVAQDKLPATGLKIILIGNNTITNALKYAVKYDKTSCDDMPLTVTTQDGVTGNLSYTYTGDGDLTAADAFTNFTVTYGGGLEATVTSANKTVAVSAPLPPLTNNENPVVNNNFGQNMGPNSNTDNQVVNGMLLTSGENEGNHQTTGGFDQTTGKFTFADGQEMTVDDIKKAVDEKVGSSAYAALFKGITINLAAGIYDLGLQDVDLEGLYDIYIQIGTLEPYSVRKLLNITTNDTKVSDQDVSFKVTLSQLMSVRIYLVKLPSTSSAPERRIGPKSSVAGGLGGISVQNNSMQSAQGPAKTYKSMEASSMATAMSAVADARDGYCCNDPDITDLPDNMFIKKSTSNAPSRRGSGVETILPEGLTFVDFSNTKITGMEVSRTSGAFNGVPENVFIYMPAGNTTKEKNVVIGGICDNLELNGSENAQPFKAMKNFTASQATLKRTFAAYNDEKKAATIYLPFAIPQDEANKLGKFYEFTGIENDEVQMKQVTTGGLKANRPYIFQAQEGGVADPMVRVANVVNNPVETEGFKGVYERKAYEDGMYCYAAEAKGSAAVGQFVEMGPNSYVSPFRAYMIGNGAPSYAIAWDGVVDLQEEETTAIENVKTVTNVKTQEGWWTISGLRLNAQPKKAGMYVFNGRLVVVK